MDYSALPPQDRGLYQAIVTGMRELAGSLESQLGPMARPVMAMAEAQVASVCPRDLRAFLSEMRDRLDSLLAHEGQPVITNPPLLALTAGEWYDPNAGEMTDREPTTLDAMAIGEALADCDDPAALALLQEAGAHILRCLRA
jgi:hypothetical protein